MATAYTKTCPDCGAVNDSNDLFCKDCGTSLAMVPNSSQQTEPFTPLNAHAEAQTTAITPVAAPQPMHEPTSVPVAPQPSYGYVSQPESNRGAVLGWLAATMMLIIIGAFIWSSVLSEATRDRFTGIF